MPAMSSEESNCKKGAIIPQAISSQPAFSLSQLAFQHRRFISIGSMILGIVLMAILGDKTSWLFWGIGLGLVFLGLAYRVYAAAFLLGRHVVTRIEAQSLCVAGPFARVRNPLYIGNFIIGLGVALALNKWYCYLIFAIEFSLMYALIIPYEEKFLTAKFGAAYEKYRAEIRRFLPRLKPYRESCEVSPDYPASLRGESLHLLILLVAFAIFYFLFIA